MNKIYLASPFFTEDQKKYVDSLEHLLDVTHYNYYSPRKDGDTSQFDLPDYFNDLKRQLIFENNITEIQSSDTIIVNLLHPDMGTAFEYGIAVGRNIIGKDKIRIISIPMIERVEDRSSTLFHESEDKDKTYLHIEVPNDMTYSDCIYLLKYIYGTYRFNDSFSRNRYIVFVDTTNSGDKFYLGAFLLGAFYHMKIKVNYISPVKSKSNLMITQAKINQYLTLTDYENGNKVIYKDKDIG